MNRRRYYNYVDEKILEYVENDPQRIFFVLSEIAGFSFEAYLKYLFTASVSMSWTACEVATFDAGNFIAQKKLEISFDSRSLSFTAKRLNNITDFNPETVLKL